MISPETLRYLADSYRGHDEELNFDLLDAAADAWEADKDIIRTLDEAREMEHATIDALRKRLEAAETNFRSLGRLACSCAVIAPEDYAEWDRLQAALAKEEK